MESYSKGDAYAQVAISTKASLLAQHSEGRQATGEGGLSRWMGSEAGSLLALAATYYPRCRAAVQDVYKTGDQIKAAGGKVTREPGPVPGIGTKILACTDPGERSKVGLVRVYVCGERSGEGGRRGKSCGLRFPATLSS